ncbi:MAG: alpha/beta fold hydrolase [Tumebacillaceae bacterium]
MKKRFAVDEFLFEAGVTLPVEIGYETYGTLNEDRSNAILLCHYFSGTSHAGGEGGWWESLIGPGKAFDTDRYFIVASDVISNLHPYSPNVITTGPATINPLTGEPYGLSFPQVTIRDFVHMQRQLLQSHGIENLHCVAGPSMGGMQALTWAVEYPDAVRKVIAVISTGRTSPYTSVVPLQIGIEAVLHAPNDSGLVTAAKALTMQSDNLLPEIALQEMDSDPSNLIPAVDQYIKNKMETAHHYHWMYLARASQSYSLANGYDSYEAALSRIQAEVLAISCDTDRLFPPEDSIDVVERLKQLNKSASYFELKSPRGHFAGVMECDQFAQPVHDFLNGQ